MKNDIQNTYDTVAENYAKEYRDEMDKKPFDRKALDLLQKKVTAMGMICDMGCGPGQIAEYLHRHGASVCGIDLSPEMVKQAQRLNTGIPFQQGNMLALTDVADDSFAGIAAFYSIIHIPRSKAVEALRQLRRVLQPEGILLVAFHVGGEIIHLDEWYGKPVFVDFIFYEVEEMKEFLKTAGFELQEILERDPYPNVEFPSHRAYIFAKRPKLNLRKQR